MDDLEKKLNEMEQDDTTGTLRQLKETMERELENPSVMEGAAEASTGEKSGDYGSDFEDDFEEEIERFVPC